ncbi:MAG: hypothetical protein ACJ8AG_18880, partial [Ktedonobacteraceae bacterium]
MRGGASVIEWSGIIFPLVALEQRLKELRQPVREARGDTAMDGHQPSTRQGIDPGSPQARPQRTSKLGQRAAQAALAFLLGAGCFLSLFPWGRAFTRSTFLLPALISASEPTPLVLAGDPVRFRRITISS